MREHQDVSTLKQDAKAQLDALNTLYGMSKMYMTYLLDDKDLENSQETTDQQYENKRFVRTWMFDNLIKSYMVLFEETLKSKELINYLKVTRL